MRHSRGKNLLKDLEVANHLRIQPLPGVCQLGANLRYRFFRVLGWFWGEIKQLGKQTLTLKSENTSNFTSKRCVFFKLVKKLIKNTSNSIATFSLIFQHLVATQAQVKYGERTSGRPPPLPPGWGLENRVKPDATGEGGGVSSDFGRPKRKKK